MSSDVAISARGLSKAYRIAHGEKNHHTTAAEALMHRLRYPLRKRETYETFWALQDVSFEIKQGEVVGVVGRNGAGKSTLLKVLSRITEPTDGEVTLHGRVGSLLEVGTGFHPELTGRENIYLNGVLLGMTRAEVQREFDAIVDFSGTEKFLDTPVKRYSSGMYVRLAFAVAAHLNPDILIVDEVLAVGDAEFQKKCLGKMGEVAQDGRTVLVVSHNLQVVSTLTQSCLLLAKGRQMAYGPTAQVLDEYTRSAMEQGDGPVYIAAASEEEPRIVRVEVKTSDSGNVQRNGQPMEVLIDVATPGPIKGGRVSFRICNDLHQPVVHLWAYDSEQPWGRDAGIHRLRCVIPHCHLYMGRYTLMVFLSEHFGGRHFQRLEGLCPFEVSVYERVREGGWEAGTCMYLEDCRWNIEKDSSGMAATPWEDYNGVGSH